MKWGLWVVLIFLGARSVNADAPPSIFDLKQQHCYRYRSKKSWSYFQKQIRDPMNRLAFRNEGGWRWSDDEYIVSGVCWWHSRFQRAATYLAIFDPAGEKPTDRRAVQIVDDLAHFRKRVVISGYKNLYEFTKEHEKVIQNELERWLKRDAISGVMRTLNPLRESFKTSRNDLRQWMARLDYLVNEHRIIPFVLQQVKGLKAHASLVIGMELGFEMISGKKQWTGFVLEMLDSNTFQIDTVRYRFGDETLKGYSHEFSPSVDYDSDLFKVWEIMDRDCESQVSPLAPWRSLSR